MDLNLLVPIISVAVLVGFLVMSTVRVVPQARRHNVERFGRYRTTLQPGLNFIIPLADRINTKLDVREQVYSSQPKPVITEDNLVVNIDTVLYYQITDPRAAAYEIADYLQAIDQLTVTTLRNVIGSMDLEQTLTSREEINTRLRIVLDEATGKWGIRVNRVEIKAIGPPITIKEAMEKQMRAERDKRAAILHAEGDDSPRSLPPKGPASRRSWWHKATSRPRSSAPTARPGRRPGLPGRPPQQRRSQGAGLQVPGDAATPGKKRKHLLGHPRRAHTGDPHHHGAFADHSPMGAPAASEIAEDGQESDLEDDKDRRELTAGQDASATADEVSQLVKAAVNDARAAVNDAEAVAAQSSPNKTLDKDARR